MIEEGLGPQIPSIHAKEMTVRDTADHLQALYGIELSITSTSSITEKVTDKAKVMDTLLQVP